MKHELSKFATVNLYIQNFKIAWIFEIQKKFFLLFVLICSWRENLQELTFPYLLTNITGKAINHGTVGLSVTISTSKIIKNLLTFTTPPNTRIFTLSYIFYLHKNTNGGMGNYCVVLEGDKNLSDEWLSQMLLSEYLMRFFRTSRNHPPKSHSNSPLQLCPLHDSPCF